ncbi:unnamed protein product [Rotaria magnacalcarata]|uniref:Uncharacterized protein n=1 Tax=Rotaria magnacalcarata TaxID=392030 RepID=A0A819K8K2_9BILA|nr:unnamed protein product [Rotaria magnacalcarata]
MADIDDCLSILDGCLKQVTTFIVQINYISDSSFISRNMSWDVNEWQYDNNSIFSVIEYSHLTSLDIIRVHLDYITQLLLETKVHLPRLTELKVSYDQLKMVTLNFIRDATRRNCSKVKRLIVEE